MVTVSPTGLATATGLACGNTLICATVTTNSSAGNRSSGGAIVTNFMTTNVVCFGSSSGGTANPALTVDFSWFRNHKQQSPGPWMCHYMQHQSFSERDLGPTNSRPTGTSVFGGWVGCDTTSGQMCTVNLITSRTVTVTFN
jgi:hypothetical protein